MRVVKFDIDAYNQTKGTGTPVYSIVEENIPDIEPVSDENGEPTRGGKIGYALAYIVMAGFIGTLFLYI